MERDSHSKSLSVWEELVVTQCQLEDKFTSTAPVLLALSDYSLHSLHTQPSGPNAQCPTTPSWFAFPHRSLCARSISPWLFTLGVCPSQGCTLCTAGPPGCDGNSTHPLSLHDAGHVRHAFLNFVATTPFHHAWLPTHLRSRGIGLWTHWCFLTHCSHREAR